MPMTEMHLLVHRYIKDGEVTHFGVHTPQRTALLAVSDMNEFVELGNVMQDYDFDAVHESHIPLEWKNQDEEWIREHVTVYDHITWLK